MTSQVYIAVSIIILAVIAALVFFVAKKREKASLTPLAGVAFGFILAGIFFGDDRMIGYGLMGIGVILAVADIVRKLRNK